MKAFSLRSAFWIFLAGTVSLWAVGGPKARSGTLVVPSGTEFKVRLHTPIDSKTSKVGEHLVATLVSPAYVDNTVAFPKGTRIEGTITSVKPATHRGRGGVVTPVFNYAVFANGEKIPILGLLTEVYPGKHTRDVRVDLEGDLRGRGPSALKRTALVAGAAAGGGVAGIGIGVVAGIGGLFGAIFLPRGHEAVLESGSLIGMRLSRRVKIHVGTTQPVAWQKPHPGHPRT